MCQAIYCPKFTFSYFFYAREPDQARSVVRGPTVQQLCKPSVFGLRLMSKSAKIKATFSLIALILVMLCYGYLLYLILPD